MLLLQGVVLSGFVMMMEAIRSVPRVESKLYSKEVGVAYWCSQTFNVLIQTYKDKGNLTPVIAEEIIDRAKEKVITITIVYVTYLFP